MVNSAGLERGKGFKKKTLKFCQRFLGLAARFNNGRAAGWLAPGQMHCSGGRSAWAVRAAGFGRCVQLNAWDSP